MKILFLTPQLPYPPISGGVIKSFKLVELLTREYQLTLACLLKSAEDENNLAEFNDTALLGNAVTYPLNIPRTPMNFAKSCMAGLPLTIYRNKSREFAATIAAMAVDFELIFVDHYLMYQYIPDDYQGRVVVHQHNAEFVIWQRMAVQTRNPIKKALLYFEASRIRRYEVAMCSRVHRVLAAPNDQQALADAGSPNHHFLDTYHLGDEENLSLPAIDYQHTQMKLLFIGTLTWEANVDGLLWFLRDSWPLIKQACPEASFTVVGKHSEALAKQLLQLAPEIDLLGFVDDLEVLYQTHRVFVAPLRFGSGIKVKVVNGLYRGIPTVTTNVGAEGMRVQSGEHLMVADSANDFAQGVITLLRHEADWQRLSVQSRQHMREHYSWDVVFKNVRRSLQDD
ncbi:MAG: glycosyltransferase involved in cell wall biosynthesis [Phenylobacterium sp.]|jgi:glycosyltransferase involved in cell wall biosynthesis